jgi:hypothetical protein
VTAVTGSHGAEPESVRNAGPGAREIELSGRISSASNGASEPQLPLRAVARQHCGRASVSHGGRRPLRPGRCRGGRSRSESRVAGPQWLLALPGSLRPLAGTAHTEARPGARLGLSVSHPGRRYSESASG